MATDVREPLPREDSLSRRAELLDEWVDVGKQIAALEARRVELLADRLDLLARERGGESNSTEMSFRSVSAEYAAAGHIPPGTAEAQLTDAWVLARQFPATMAALASGEITRRHADVILNEAPPVSGKPDAEQLRAEYERQVIPFAANDTAARTRVHARAVTARVCPETVADQHRSARKERTVTVKPDGQGMAVLTAILPELLAYAVHDRLTAMARAVTKARPEGQRRPTKTSRSKKEAARAAALAGQEPSGPEPPIDLEAALEDDLVEQPPWAAQSDRRAAAERRHPGHDDGPSTEPEDLSPDDWDAQRQDGWSDCTDDIPPDGAVWHDAVPIDDGYGATETDTRSMDQLRADILADLLLTSDPTTITETAFEAIHATVHITVAAGTLTGDDDRLAELEGSGPLVPEAARFLAGHAPSWDRLFLDPRGMTVATDNYVPTAGMKRFLRARDEHCRFPGCRAPAHRCQIDHNHDHAKGGQTRVDNLSLFCASHHTLKHPDLPEADRWTAQQLDDGVIVWASPLGRTYPDAAPLRVMFT